MRTVGGTVDIGAYELQTTTLVVDSATAGAAGTPRGERLAEALRDLFDL